METSVQVSVVEDVVVPVEVVTLKHLRTQGGAMRVGCSMVNELVITEVMQALPGLRAKRVADGEPEAQTPEQAFESVKELDALAPRLIEEGTFLVAADGSEVRPAFYFDETKPRHAKSLPGRMLRIEDKSLLVEAILRVGGYLPGGRADEGSFLSGERGGDGGGVGTVPAGEGVGSNAVGSEA